MKIKSYFVHAVGDAMSMARQEFGPDAVLVQTRRTPPEGRHLGEYEVVFGSAPAEDASEGIVAGLVQPAIPDRLAGEVAELKKQLESMRLTITRSTFAPAQWLGSTPDVSEAYATLTASGITAELAREVVQSTERRAEGPWSDAGKATQAVDRKAFQIALVEELESRFAVEALLGRGETRPRLAAFVGPPGSGKTTTLVKLAVQYGLASRRPVLLLSMDTYRVAAAEQLRAYASILGVHFQLLETVRALAQAIEESRGKDLVLIDTPGLCVTELDDGHELARFLCSRTDVDTQLVLPASMKSADLTRLIDCYEIFRPQRLLFTRLDETGSFGSIFNEAARTRKPLSFFTAGQRIPEDLETVTRSRLVQLVLSGQHRREASAA